MAGLAILGSGGRLGAALVQAWRAAGETVHALPRTEVDLGDSEALRRALDALDFDVAVNCAALTNVDFCETHPGEAQRINAEAVGELGRLCAARGARCVHISTDYVFDGEKREPYAEEDAAVPISHYGASKLAGEEALLAAESRHLAVRVSWVFGPDRPSFVDQILQKAQQEETVAAIADKWAVPTCTEDVAGLLRPFLREIPEGGRLHLCNGGACTWQEYGQYALDCASELGVSLRARTVAPLRMAELKAFIARRPVSTVLSTQKLERLSGQTPRTWQEAVKAYVRSIFETAPGVSGGGVGSP